MAVLQMVKAAFINAHSDPGLDKSSIHFTRPARPREDRNPLIWKHDRQKVSRFRASRQPHTGRFLEPHSGFGRFVAGFPGYGLSGQTPG
jgi:hypothetical protein